MTNRDKIIQLLQNPLVTGYGMEMMSNGQLYSANFQRYKNRVKKEENPLIIFESMTVKVEQVFLELAEEVIRTNPKTKQEFKEMIRECSYKEDNKW
ncbi:hypothetical protein [Enterococcus faecalis]|jgi:hypothetical protein|uniref:hypothetical protein n=1 Tax=Enterococcus TaxID=1350 RepID=UPI00080C41EB|nr:hypothetical protein [Enterococcus faecalis]ANU71941.1 hypothetical protein A4V06_02215 [Enterococcus faecalis]ARV05057.1 hypothetical protein A6B47_14255 [Enterococcus faecalis]ASU26641.1 hypothetical protein ADH73_11540 [Enterococcus faecalis]EGO8197542.1 hypothetical protein [Enterococcus faecalis]MBG9437150.1 hypothetical protein [Enterococcus faecalis]